MRGEGVTARTNPPGPNNRVSARRAVVSQQPLSQATTRRVSRGMPSSSLSCVWFLFSPGTGWFFVCSHAAMGRFFIFHVRPGTGWVEICPVPAFPGKAVPVDFHVLCLSLLISDSSCIQYRISEAGFPKTRAFVVAVPRTYLLSTDQTFITLNNANNPNPKPILTSTQIHQPTSEYPRRNRNLTNPPHATTLT